MRKKTYKQSYGFALPMRLFAVPVMALVAGLLVVAQPASAAEDCSSATSSDCVEPEPTPDPPFTCPDGTTPQDTTGDGVVDMRDCEIDIVDPDLRGDVTVKGGCGFVRVTNHEKETMRFHYGRANHKLDRMVRVTSGATRKISTSWRLIDWQATWRNHDPRSGNNLRVRQNCGSNAVVKPPPTVYPPALPNTGA